MDVDGNDLAIADAAIMAWSPKIIVGEYNAKFPYPMQQEVTYNPQHRWARDDYHGASLAAWVRLKPSYCLVTATSPGPTPFSCERIGLSVRVLCTVAAISASPLSSDRLAQRPCIEFGVPWKFASSRCGGLTDLRNHGSPRDRKVRDSESHSQEKVCDRQT